MTPSPFSNVVGHDPGDSTYQRVEATAVADTTTASASRPDDSPTEPSIGVEVSTGGVTHVSGQDETPGDASSGTPSP